MKPVMILLVAGIAFTSLQHAVVAQTLMNPGGLRGAPTVQGPVGGFASPIGGGPRLEPVKIDLKPTLPSGPTPTVRTNPAIGSRNLEPEAPKRPVPPSAPEEPTPDGDAQTPEVSGGPTVDVSAATAGEGDPGPHVPSSPPKSGGDFPWWIVIGVGLLAVVLYRVKRGHGS